MINQILENLDEKTYICNCGCNIEFQPYLLGCEMHLIYDGIANNEQYLFTQFKMLNNSWNNYIDVDAFKTWGELWNYIKNNKNKNNVIEHLYNEYLASNIPADSILYLDYIF
jgi:hypothetical protein